MEENKLKILYASTLQSLIANANKRGISGEKVINILPMSEQYALIYYGEE